MFWRGPPCSLLWVSAITARATWQSPDCIPVSFLRASCLLLCAARNTLLNTWVITARHLLETESRSPLPEPPGVCLASLPLPSLHSSPNFPVQPSPALPNPSAWNPPPQGPPVGSPLPRTALHSVNTSPSEAFPDTHPSRSHPPTF